MKRTARSHGPSSHRCELLALAALVLAPLAIATSALANSYHGHSDTGWDFHDNRECCETAVWLAQEDSMRLCENAGGHPKVRSGSTRGLCNSVARGGGRDRIYRCTAKADVYCR